MTRHLWLAVMAVLNSFWAFPYPFPSFLVIRVGGLKGSWECNWTPAIPSYRMRLVYLRTLTICFPEQAVWLRDAQPPGVVHAWGLSGNEGVLCEFGLGPPEIVGRPPKTIPTRVAQGCKPLCLEADWDTVWGGGGIMEHDRMQLHRALYVHR